MTQSPQMTEAARLIREEAQQSGTAAKLAELEKQSPKEEDIYWGDIWSAFIAATDMNGIEEMHKLPE